MRSWATTKLVGWIPAQEKQQLLKEQQVGLRWDSYALQEFLSLEGATMFAWLACCPLCGLVQYCSLQCLLSFHAVHCVDLCNHVCFDSMLFKILCIRF